MGSDTRAVGSRRQRDAALLHARVNGSPARQFGSRAHYRVQFDLPAVEITIAPLPSSGFGHSHAAGFVAAAGIAACLAAPAPAMAQTADDVPVITASANPASDTESPDERVGAAHSVEAEPAEIAVPTPKMPVTPEIPLSAVDDVALGWRDLYLEVFINDKTTGLIGNFKESPDGALVIEPKELTEVGLQPAREALGPDGLVRMDKLPGVSFQIDESAQRLYVQAGMDERSSRRIDLAAQADARIASASGYGAVLNYSLFASTTDLVDSKQDRVLSGISGDFDARVFTPFGTVNQSFITGYTDGELQGVTRLNTTWSYSDQKRMMTYRAGDIVTGGLSWTRPVYMGGIQIQRNFSLRPDLVTLPLPSFQGTAAVPSTIEVYTQNAQTYSGEVGEGPFQLDNLPVYAGNGETRVVLRDALGRETETSLPFYTSANMLAKGLFDFSADVGFARRNFGTDSFDYDERVYGVLTGRYGLTNRMTLEGHAEIGVDLINGGLGATVPLAHYGAITVAGAGSYHDGMSGGLVSASFELQHNSWSLYGRTQRTFGDYKDIAAITATNTKVHGLPLGGYDVPRAIDQVAVSGPGLFDMSSLAVSYTHVEARNGERSQLVGASYSQTLMDGKLSLYASAFADLEKKDSFGVFAGVSMPIGKNMTASTAVDHSAGGTSVTAELSKAESMEDGSFGWRVRATEGKVTNREARGSYRSPWARFEAGVQQYEESVRATAQVDGAIAVAGGDVFATHKIHDSFAVVDVGVPGVEVLYENRPVGKSNSRGKKLVTGLDSYEPRTISIDPKGLPVDANIKATKAIVVPGNQSAVKVDFGVSDDPRAALVGFVDAAGKPIEAGVDGSVKGGEDFVVGYDGQAYISGLGRQNSVTLKTDFGQSCKASFAYKPSKGEQIVINNVKCL